MASAPAAAPAPAAASDGNSTIPPGTVIAGLVVEPYGPLPALWATFFVFGNLFAIFWLARAFLNAHPEIAYKIGLAFGRLGLGWVRNSSRRKKARQSEAPTAVSSEDGGPVKQPKPLSPLSAQDVRFVKADSAANGTAEELGHADSGPQSSNARRNTHHHTQPIICTPSTELEATNGSLAVRSPQAPGSPDSPDSHQANGHVGGERCESDGHSSSSNSSCSSYSSDDDCAKQHVQLEWINMCYSVKSAAGPKTIVQGIYGCAKPYQLQGLMGPSGAGKSTIMDLLAMRTDHDGAAAAGAADDDSDDEGSMAQAGGPEGQAGPEGGVAVAVDELAAAAAGGDGSSSSSRALPGQLLVNGVRVKRQVFMSISAYVPQHDNLVPTMTAWEAVTFYASIILPPDTPAATRKARIARVLRMMGLTHAQHTLVGGTLPGGIMLRGMSGGERKRLAIACGVVSGPSLIFLDEPTSGLDSFAALNVVLFLKSMATERGATLLASLHQPRAAIWSQLDQVTLLSSGRLMYTGPTDGLVPWFKSLGYYFDPETHGMASDWALDLVALGFTKPQHEHHAAAAPAGEDSQTAEQQQQGSVQLQGSVRPEGSDGNGASSKYWYLSQSGLESSGAPLQQQQQQQLAPAPSMMSSQQELTDAADAFVKQLQMQHPQWFKPARPSSSNVAGLSEAGDRAIDADAFKRRRNMQSGGSAGDAAAADQDGPDRGSGYTAAGPDSRPDNTLSSLTSMKPSNSKQLSLVGEEGGPFAAQELLPADGGYEQQQLQPIVGAGGGRGVLFQLWTALHKYRALLWRELLITTRNPADVGGRMMTFTYVSVISGLVSWSLPGDANSIFQRMSVCYAVLTFYFLMPFVFMSIFTSDKRFFAADTTARLYHPAQYYLSKVTIALPFNIAVAIVFHLVYYGMVGMRHGAEYMAASCLICVLTGLIGMQAVYCCAIMASSQDLAFVYAIGWTSLNLLVNPYMNMFQLYSLGWGFSWLRFFSPCSFAWQALVNIEFKGRGFDCNHGSGAEAVGLIPALLPDDPAFRAIRNNINNLGRISTNRQCIASGDAIISMYTMGLSFWETVGVLIGFYVLFLSVTYLVVARSAKKKSKI